MNGKMEKIDFNTKHFNGFHQGERILLDTGIILALANEYDSWHGTVKELFDRYILTESQSLFLYINPTILNEITHLADKPFNSYLKKHPEFDSSRINPREIVDKTVTSVKRLIRNEVLLIVDGNKESTIKQIELYKKLGSADAVNVSIANGFCLSILTVDFKLTNNVYHSKGKLGNIPKIYYTNPGHQDYR
jgi:predicted nucleic acid-binding protein